MRRLTPGTRALLCFTVVLAVGCCSLPDSLAQGTLVRRLMAMLEAEAAPFVVDASTFGVVCDGTTQTAAALQTAVNAAKTGTTGVILAMPRGGNCLVNSTITLSNVAGFILDGNETTWTWTGAAAVPMLLLQDVRDSVLRNFNILAQPSQPLLAAIQMENSAAATVTPTHTVVENVIIECVSGGCTNGIRLAQGAGGDNNNDFHQFFHVSVSNYTNAAAKLEHAQSKHNAFIDFTCVGNSIGAHCIETNPSGSFQCQRCRGGYHTAADFYVSNPDDVISIVDSNFEGSARFFETAGPSGAIYPVTIATTRWANNNLHADNRAIIFQFRGPLVLLNNLFEASNPTRALEIYVNTFGGQGAFVSMGNAFASTRTSPYTGLLAPSVNVGNVINRNDGNGAVALTQVATQLQVYNATPSTDTFAVLSDSGAGPKLRFNIENNPVEPADVNWRDVNLTYGLSTIAGISSRYFGNAFYAPITIFQPGSTTAQSWQVNSSGTLSLYTKGIAGLGIYLAGWGEAQGIWTVAGDTGKVSWGPGGNTAPDVALERTSPGTLQVTNTSDGSGGVLRSTSVQFTTVTFANLTLLGANSLGVCSNCVVTSGSDNTCASGAGVAMVLTVSNVHRCFQLQN